MYIMLPWPPSIVTRSRHTVRDGLRLPPFKQFFLLFTLLTKVDIAEEVPKLKSKEFFGKRGVFR